MIKEKVLKEVYFQVNEDGDSSVEDYNEEMLQHSAIDIKEYLSKTIDLTLAEASKVIFNKHDGEIFYRYQNPDKLKKELKI